MAVFDDHRTRIITQRSAATLAFLFCVLTRQALLLLGLAKRDDSIGSLLLKQPYWFLASAVIGAVTGAILGYLLSTRWLARNPKRPRRRFD